MPWINTLTNALNEIPSTCKAYDVLFLSDGMLRLQQEDELKQMSANSDVRNREGSFDEHEKDISAINMLVMEHDYNFINQGEEDYEDHDDDEEEEDYENYRMSPVEYGLVPSNHDPPKQIQPSRHNANNEIENSIQQPFKHRIGCETFFENFPGNNRFYIFISMFRREYMDYYHQGKEVACDDIARRIVSIICDDCNPPGKFIEYDLFNMCCHWKEIDREDAVGRVKLAFLDPPTVALSRAFPYHDTEQVNINDMCDMSEEHTLTTGLSSTAFQTNDMDFGGQLGFSCHGSKSMDESEYLDSFLSQRQSDSVSNDASSSIDTVCHRVPPSFKMKRNKRRHKIETDDKFRRRGVLATCWQEDENNFDLYEEQMIVNLGKEIFLIDSNLVKLVEKNFTEIIDRAIRDDSIITDMGEDFGRVKISSSDTGSMTYKRKRKYEKKDTNEKIEVIKLYEIEHKKVHTISGGVRNLSELDILCEMGPQYYPEPMNVNHIGNNRLKATVQMNIKGYQQSLSCKMLRSRIIFQIMSNICVGTKGQVSFLYPKDDNLWAEYEMHIGCKILMNFLERCILDPSLYLLPPVGTPVYIGKTPVITMKALQQDSLEVIRRRRKKRSNNIIRDVKAVESLQRTVSLR